MHEMGIALEIVRIAERALPATAEGAPVEKVHMNIGRLSAVVPESLRFCFSFVVKGTLLEGAELVIHDLPATVRCRACDHEYGVEEPVFHCPRCGGSGGEIVSGRELSVVSIEIRE
jgi:hydrogenase nickel incorporation protein HypA/HybF